MFMLEIYQMVTRYWDYGRFKFFHNALYFQTNEHLLLLYSEITNDLK